VAAKHRIRRRDLSGRRQYRIIPSRFPPIEVFESLADADELEILYAIEGLSNDRLRAAAGDLCGFHASRPLIPAHAGPAFHGKPGRG